MKTFKGKLVALRHELGGYITYVFQNLDSSLEYELCVRMPNWEVPFPVINDEGYVTINEVIGGKDTWYDKNEEKHKVFNYTNVFFINFIHSQKEDNLYL